ncbi:unnamed protein product [Echinostoma caproni]|uniref:Reverse transcriptase domain-containing protein n=1 Tax=Echinostoma caproni TaxID=27848 RepID=A0A183AVI5_9TREM|nr:unnamed protein product [Echinostoma caproni]
MFTKRKQPVIEVRDEDVEKRVRDFELITSCNGIKGSAHLNTALGALLSGRVRAAYNLNLENNQALNYQNLKAALLADFSKEGDREKAMNRFYAAEYIRTEDPLVHYQYIKRKISLDLPQADNETREGLAKDRFIQSMPEQVKGKLRLAVVEYYESIVFYFGIRIGFGYASLKYQAEGDHMSTTNIQACSCTIQSPNCIATVVVAYRAPLSDEEEDGQLCDYLARSKAHSRVVVGNLVNADGVSAASSKEKAEVLKNFFEKVRLTDLGRPLPNLLRRLPEQRMAPFVLEAKEVEAALKQLDQNKAAGPDGLHSAILRPIENIIAGALTQLYNLSLDSATLPADWIMAEVVPIPKGGSRANASNYLPAILLLVVLKTFERPLREKLVGYLDDKHLTAG